MGARCSDSGVVYDMKWERNGDEYTNECIIYRGQHCHVLFVAMYQWKTISHRISV